MTNMELRDMCIISGRILTNEDLKGFLYSRGLKDFYFNIHDHIIEVNVEQYFVRLKKIQQEINERIPVGSMIILKKMSFFEWILSLLIKIIT